MGAKIAGFVTCLMCAIPFFIIGHYKNSNEPIGLWTEDSRLRTKIHPVKQFNEEMSKVYLCCALVFLRDGAYSSFTCDDRFCVFNVGEYRRYIHIQKKV